MVTPDVSSLGSISGSVTFSSVPVGNSVKHTITLDSDVVIMRYPNVSISTANADVELVSGGKNKFTVKAIDNDTAVQDITIDYMVYVINNI